MEREDTEYGDKWEGRGRGAGEMEREDKEYGDKWEEEEVDWRNQIKSNQIMFISAVVITKLNYNI